MSTLVTVLLIISLVETFLLSFFATAFVLLYQYATGGEWKTLPEGRHLMRFTTVLAITFWATFASQLATLVIPTWTSYIVDFFNTKIPVLVIVLTAQVIIFGALLAELCNRLRLMLQGNHITGKKNDD